MLIVENLENRKKDKKKQIPYIISSYRDNHILYYGSFWNITCLFNLTIKYFSIICLVMVLQVLLLLCNTYFSQSPWTLDYIHVFVFVNNSVKDTNAHILSVNLCSRKLIPKDRIPESVHMSVLGLLIHIAKFLMQRYQFTLSPAR